MTTNEALANGLSAARRTWHMVALFWMANLLLAAALAAPMHAAIADHLGKSAFGERLASGFDAGWLMEFQFTHADFLKGFGTTIAVGAVLFLVLITIMSAGAFEVLAGEFAPHRPGDYRVLTMHAFGRGIGRYWARFGRLILIASVLYFVAFWFWQGPVDYALEYIFADRVVERPLFYLQWVRWALLALTVISINATVDLAKADLVVDDHASAFAALGHAAGFMFARFGRVLYLWIVLAILSGVTVFVYAAFARFFPQSSAWTVLIWFIVAQLLMFARWMVRTAAWATAVAYYGARPHVTQPQVEPVVEPI